MPDPSILHFDATHIPAQATADPTLDQQAQIVAFETGFFTARVQATGNFSLHYKI